MRDLGGGYYYLNNAAIAAQAMRNSGAERAAILDVDYHHGNGTQSIFYDRSDVLFVSIHGDPQSEFPYYLGYEAIARLGMPTLFVMEGGYAVDDIGVNTMNVLSGFEQKA